jgi:hypothetical protein
VAGARGFPVSSGVRARAWRSRLGVVLGSTRESVWALGEHGVCAWAARIFLGRIARKVSDESGIVGSSLDDAD